MATALANDVLLETVTGTNAGPGSTAIQELSTQGASKASLEVIVQALVDGGAGGP